MHFTLGVNSYMFGHLVAISRKFINNKSPKSYTYFRH